MARFARLEIPRDRIGEFETLLDTTPESLPALDVVAEDLILNDRRLGALELRAVNSGSAAAPVWQVQQLRIRNAAATLSASGSWQTRPGAVRRATAMDFELEMRDAGGLLTLFGFRDTLRAGIGRLNGQIRWEGSPLRLSGLRSRSAKRSSCSSRLTVSQNFATMMRCSASWRSNWATDSSSRPIRASPS